MKKTTKPVKKMKAGGSAGCPPGQCPKYVGGKREGCEPCKAGILAGITAGLSGIAGVTGAIIKDKVKNAKEKQKVKEIFNAAKKAKENTPTAKFKKDLKDKLKTQKRGGVVKSKTNKK